MRHQLTAEQRGTLRRAQREGRIMVTLVDGYVALVVPWRCSTTEELAEVVARLSDALAGLDLGMPVGGVKP